METILFIVIAVIISIIQNRAEKAKKKSQQPPPWQPRRDTSSSDVEDNDDSEDTDEEEAPAKPFAARKLQEYIKQFEEAQREASQGTLEPAMPPPIPERRKREYNPFITLQEIAAAIIDFDFVDVEYFMEDFGMSEGTALSTIAELQKHHIIGHDMGEHVYDVLVHDQNELQNLLKRGEWAAIKPETIESPALNEKQNQLKILEERARKAREEADEAARQSDIINGYVSETASSEPEQRRVVRSISKESVRRGFIWGKIIDEPRFKKRWSPAQR